MEPSHTTTERAPSRRPPAPPAGYSERARQRLRIAARLLPSRLRPCESLGERFETAVLDVIDRLDVGVRERLRAQVDWVEAYESSETALASARQRRRG